jgi:hypothetical protein
MQLTYLLNVLNFLEGRAQRYYAADRYLRAVWGVFSSDEPSGPRDAVRWIRRTPLWEALSAQAATRVFGQPFRVEPNAGV